MNNKSITAPSIWVVLLLACLAASTPGRLAAQRVVFSTGFEAAEGYRTDADLAGQKGGQGTSGDGVVHGVIEGLGQQGYVGFSAPAGATNFFYYVYHSLPPIPATEPVIKFSVTMAVVDSSSTN